MTTTAATATWRFLFGDPWSATAHDASHVPRRIGETGDGASLTPAVSQRTDDREARNAHDLALTQCIRNGDGGALDTLLRSYADVLFAATFRILNDRVLAQDVVQDVFMRLWSGRERLVIHGSVAAYLMRAVRNRARDVLSHERAQHTVAERAFAEVDTADAVAEGPTQDDVVSAERRQAIAEAIASLSPRVREIFLMRVEQELSYAEIAEVLEIGVTSVHKQMYRATRALAERLARWIEPGAE